MKNRILLWAAFFAGLGMLIMSKKVWAIPNVGMAYFPFFQRSEYQFGLPPRLLARVAWQESRFNPAAYNQASGARGMMQIIPKWHPEVTVTDLNPIDDIEYAAKYLRENFDRFGTWARALAAYNWGPTNVENALEEHGSNWLAAAPQETQEYVTSINDDLGTGIT